MWRSERTEPVDPRHPNSRLAAARSPVMTGHEATNSTAIMHISEEPFNVLYYQVVHRA